jgi:hypothetical protein
MPVMWPLLLVFRPCRAHKDITNPLSWHYVQDNGAGHLDGLSLYWDNNVRQHAINGQSYTATPPYIFMDWYLINRRDFAFTYMLSH